MKSHAGLKHDAPMMHSTRDGVKYKIDDRPRTLLLNLICSSGLVDLKAISMAFACLYAVVRNSCKRR